jgi:hypothetical protein
MLNLEKPVNRAGDQQTVAHGPNLAHSPYGLSTTNDFYISKWLGGRKAQKIFCDTWKV